MPTVEVPDPNDARLAPYRDLRDRTHRLRDGCFVAETREVIRQVLSAGRFRLRSVLTTPSGFAALGALPADLDVLVAPLAVLKQVVGFDFHRGCLALGERGPSPSLDDVLAARPRRLLLLDEVTNPDNTGGLFRNARAFGVDGVLLSAGALDPLYRKVVRVSLGAAVVVPFAPLDPWGDGLARLGAAGILRVALVSRDGTSPDVLASVDRPVALLVGNEGSGLRPESIAAADLRVTIPMAPDVDSLNVVVAAGIALERLARAELGEVT